MSERGDESIWFSNMICRIPTSARGVGVPVGSRDAEA